jgi:hypothetical protein
MADWGTKIKTMTAQGFSLYILRALMAAVCRSMHSTVMFGCENDLLGSGLE